MGWKETDKRLMEEEMNKGKNSKVTLIFKKIKFMLAFHLYGDKRKLALY